MHYNDREDQHHNLSDVKFLHTTCIKKKDYIKLTLSQFVAEIYEDDFNTLSLSTQTRLLSEFVSSSNFPPLFN